MMGIQVAEGVAYLYSPKSVVGCYEETEIWNSYWVTIQKPMKLYRVYIDMNFDGLRDDDPCSMLGGER